LNFSGVFHPTFTYYLLPFCQLTCRFNHQPELQIPKLFFQHSKPIFLHETKIDKKKLQNKQSSISKGLLNNIKEIFQQAKEKMILINTPKNIN